MGWTEATQRVSKPVRGVAWNHVLGKKDSTRSFETEAEADAWWRGRESELQGVYHNAGVNKPRQQRTTPTLVDFGEYYLPRRDRERSTHDQNLSLFRTQVNHFWGRDIKVTEVTKVDVHEMLFHVKQRGCGPSGRRNHLGVLRSVFAGAIEHHYRQDDPTRGVPSPHVPNRKQTARSMTLNEVSALHAAMPPWLAASVFLLGHAGLRISEACGLQIASVNELDEEILVKHTLDDRGRLRPYPKGKEPLPVPMGPTLRKIMTSHIEEHSSPETGFVLFNPVHNISVRPAALRKYFYAAVESAGLAAPRPTPHDLRHFCASHLARNGAEAYDIQAILRHRNLVTSQRYIDDINPERRARLPLLFETG